MRIWGDAKFRALSPVLPSAQSLFLYYLQGPHHHGMPGLHEVRRLDLTDRLGWPLNDFDACHDELQQAGMADADWHCGVLWLPNWLNVECNRPRSPSNVKGWRREFDRIPECSLKHAWYEQLADHCAERGWGEPW